MFLNHDASSLLSEFNGGIVMTNKRMVWTDKQGDLRKTKESVSDEPVNEKKIILKIRRLTSGKGRCVIEISDLPKNKKWCQKLSKDLKVRLGVGGSYKDRYIEIHGEKIKEIMDFLDLKSIKWKKTGG